MQITCLISIIDGKKEPIFIDLGHVNYKDITVKTSKKIEDNDKKDDSKEDNDVEMTSNNINTEKPIYIFGYF